MPLKSHITLRGFEFVVATPTGIQSGTATVTWHSGEDVPRFSEIALDVEGGRTTVLHPRLLDHAVIATEIQRQCLDQIVDRLFGRSAAA